MMLLDEIFISIYEYRSMSFSSEDRSILLFEATFDSHGVQVDGNSLKLSFVI